MLDTADSQTLELDADEIRQLEAMAAKRNLSMNELLAELTWLWLAGYECYE
jgi:hypothetical protein